METTPETGPDLGSATKGIIRRIVAIFHNRAELFVLEVQEERERAQMIIFLAAGIAILGLLGGITLTAVIALAAGAHYFIALVILTVLYIGGAAFFAFKLVRMTRDWEPFNHTRDQLQKDHECFQKTLT